MGFEACGKTPGGAGWEFNQLHGEGKLRHKPTGNPHGKLFTGNPPVSQRLARGDLSGGWGQMVVSRWQ